MILNNFNEKIYVLDTNVLLNDPEAIFSFEDNMVVITEAVIEELDNKKRGYDDIAFNSRETGRLIGGLRDKGNLSDGVHINTNGIFKIESNHKDVDIPASWDIQKRDHRIIQVCVGLKQDYPDNEVILVTEDLMLMIKADIVGVKSEKYLKDAIDSLSEQYTGRMQVYVDTDVMNDIRHTVEIYSPRGTHTTNNISYSEDINLYDDQYNLIDNSKLVHNMFLLITDIANFKNSVLAYYNKKDNSLILFKEKNPFGIIPKNSAQRFAIEALTRPVEQTPVVILKGPAGTAKTFLALASALDQTLENEKLYRKILVCRPNVLMDDDLGYLPGSEQEKIAPLMRPIIDNLEILVDSDEKERYHNEKDLQGRVDYVFKDTIRTEAVGYLRGRSIVGQYIIIDEAQNITAKTMKGILTRAGKGTKIVVLGDPQQVDHPYLSSKNNGLTYASELLKGHDLCMQMTFTNDECNRSELAEAISKLF